MKTYNWVLLVGRSVRPNPPIFRIRVSPGCSNFSQTSLLATLVYKPRFIFPYFMITEFSHDLNSTECIKWGWNKVSFRVKILKLLSPMFYTIAWLYFQWYNYEAQHNIINLPTDQRYQNAICLQTNELLQ